MRFSSVNKQLAVEPFTTTATTSRVVNGIAVIDSKITITGLKVVFGSERFPTGSTVYLRTDVINKHVWSKEIYTLEDKRFILVPEDAVILLAVEPPSDYVYTQKTGYKGEFGGE